MDIFASKSWNGHVCFYSKWFLAKKRLLRRHLSLSCGFCINVRFRHRSAILHHFAWCKWSPKFPRRHPSKQQIWLNSFVWNEKLASGRSATFSGRCKITLRWRIFQGAGTAPKPPRWWRCHSWWSVFSGTPFSFIPDPSENHFQDCPLLGLPSRRKAWRSLTTVDHLSLQHQPKEAWWNHSQELPSASSAFQLWQFSATSKSDALACFLAASKKINLPPLPVHNGHHHRILTNGLLTPSVCFGCGWASAWKQPYLVAPWKLVASL